MKKTSKELFEEAFGDLSETDKRRVDEIVHKLSGAIADLIPFMHGDDAGGEVRVGAMLVSVGKQLAGVE